MASLFEPPPTYSEPVIVVPGKKPGEPGATQFNPLWLKWFLDFVAFVQSTSTGGSIIHNNLQGLQGGTTNQYYHLNGTEYAGTGSGNLVRQNAPTLTGATVVSTIKPAASGYLSSDGSAGFTGTLTTASLVGKTVTIKDGIITNIA